ncbi:LppX_LprAFG lipoprotein [Planomonospora corallina]|uniref:LppX_LprAFG lipoprotein n=1 Tax=Planomonospora corallina TaxID=1806052 RepID=A0ABV8I7W8_9ACTN
MSARRIIIAALATALSLVTACSGDPGSQDALPGGPDLVKKSAAAMRTVKSAAFTMETENTPQLRVKKAAGRLSATGDADGTLQLDFAGSLQEISFVLAGDTVYFKGVTGGFQRMSRSQLASIYDPSAILDPDRGIVQLLSGALDPETKAEEKVGGADAYRLEATLSQQILAALVPDIAQNVDGVLWIDKATSRLLKAELPLSATGKATVSLTDYDVPVQVTAPTG